MRLRFLGAARVVTGSCFHLMTDDYQILVECGMYQGRGADDVNRAPFQFDPARIDCLLLTHAHLDHSGLIPKLVKEGFRGKILTTVATGELVEIMLLDSAHIQEKDAEWATKKSYRAGSDVVTAPLYTNEDVKRVFPLIEKRSYGEMVKLGKDLECRFVDAGHILGSGSLEIWYQSGDQKKKIVFSGDVGKCNSPIINDPQYIEESDYVVIESTYGNRLHKGSEESIEELADAIRTTFSRGGNVLIPAFAVGRTQDIVYMLDKLAREGRLPRLDIYIDSPLADKVSKIYMAHPELYDEEASERFNMKKTGHINLNFTSNVEESQKLNRIKSKAIVIAGSGMCEGGRIRHHFKHNIWRPECSIIFTGYQVRGTLGRLIVDGVKRLKILGEEMAIRSRVFTIGGFSAHADQKELLEWLGAFKSRPRVFVVHGEETASLQFGQAVKKNLGLEAQVPYKGEEIQI